MESWEQQKMNALVLDVVGTQESSVAPPGVTVKNINQPYSLLQTPMYHFGASNIFAFFERLQELVFRFPKIYIH